MNFSQTISILSNYKIEKLKGRIAHEEIAPFRAKYNKKKTFSPKIAGVLVLLYPVKEQTYFALIERTTYKGQHSGQISFPGGKEEKEDLNIIHTALREAWEETNINKDEVEIIGKLSKIFIPPSNFEVTPILATSKNRPQFIPNNREVVDVLEVKLKDLINPLTIKNTKIELDDGKVLNTPCFYINSKTVWGATAMILNELKHYFLDAQKENH